jgi:hypothetical protein
MDDLKVFCSLDFGNVTQAPHIENCSKKQLDKYRRSNQMRYPDTPQFLSLPEELQKKFCVFPKELSSKSVLEFSSYYFNISQTESKKENGNFKNLVFKSFDVWSLNKDPFRIILIQGKNKNNFYVLGFFNETFHQQEYEQMLTFLENYYAKFYNIKEYEIEEKENTKKKKIFEK